MNGNSALWWIVVIAVGMLLGAVLIGQCGRARAGVVPVSDPAHAGRVIPVAPAPPMPLCC